jgi:hypothetical protein
VRRDMSIAFVSCSFSILSGIFAIIDCHWCTYASAGISILGGVLLVVLSISFFWATDYSLSGA